MNESALLIQSSVSGDFTWVMLERALFVGRFHLSLGCTRPNLRDPSVKSEQQ